MIGAAGGALLAGKAGALAQVASPAVRRKVKLTYWNWADNPPHQKISLDSVDMFNKSQNFIEVEVDATMAVMESRKKLVVAHAADVRRSEADAPGQARAGLPLVRFRSAGCDRPAVFPSSRT